MRHLEGAKGIAPSNSLNNGLSVGSWTKLLHPGLQCPRFIVSITWTTWVDVWDGRWDDILNVAMIEPYRFIL